MTTITGGLNLVLLGKTGAGKSATGNTILGRQAFISKKSLKSITQDVAVESGAVFELPVHVYDTPDFFDTELKEQAIQFNYQNLFQRCESGLCVFLLVIKADRFTQEERKTVEKIEELLGPKRLEKTWILFTRGDELQEENMTIQEFLNDTEPLKKLVQKYDQRFHVFNNKTKEDCEQVKILFAKLLLTHLDTVVEADSLKQNPLKRKTAVNAEPPTPVSSLSSRRIILLGKTGVGKSASGNTILGQKDFTSVMSMSSVTSKCSDAHATVSGRSVSVVDTPGLLDTKMNPKELTLKIAESVYMSSPGPHAFLIVFPVNMRYTEHEQQIPQNIEMMFGQEVLKYSIVLFTHGDQLEEKTVKDLIEENCRLRDLVDQCGGRYHVFNNKDQKNREQVNKLLQKIDTMIEQNGGGHYSNQMFEDAQRFRQEEEERRKREEEERKLQMEKQIQEEIERVMKEREERIRAEMKTRQKIVSKEEQKKQEEQRKEDIERVKKETEERIRTELKSKLKETTSQSGFLNFYSKYKDYFRMAAFVLAGILIGAASGVVVGAVAGAVYTAAATGGVTASIAGGLSVSVGAASAATSAAASAGVVVGAAKVGAAAGAVVGAAAGAVFGVADSKDTR